MPYLTCLIVLLFYMSNWPYGHVKNSMKETSTNFGIVLMFLGLELNFRVSQIMVKRQRTAFPPNFVHSLDGSHMMMTAVACKKAGLNFAGLLFWVLYFDWLPLSLRSKHLPWPCNNI